VQACAHARLRQHATIREWAHLVACLLTPCLVHHAIAQRLRHDGSAVEVVRPHTGRRV
jgi:hypothetical protein